MGLLPCHASLRKYYDHLLFKGNYKYAILTALFQHDLINVVYLTACYLYQAMVTMHFMNEPEQFFYLVFDLTLKRV